MLFPPRCTNSVFFKFNYTQHVLLIFPDNIAGMQSVDVMQSVCLQDSANADSDHHGE